MGVRSCLVTFNKVILAIINIVVVLVGLATFVLGVASKTTNTLLFDIVTSGTFDIPILLIIFGLVLAVVGVVGFVASVCAHRFLSKIVLFIYAAFLVVIIIIDIGGAIAALVEQNRISTTFNSSTYDNFEKISGKNKQFIAWDNVQKELSCCGPSSYRDWFTVVWNNNNSIYVPPSCCVTATDTAMDCPLQPSGPNQARFYHDKGCSRLISDQVGSHIGVLAGIVIVIVLVLIVVVVLTCLVTFCKAETSYSRFDEVK